MPLSSPINFWLKSLATSRASLWYCTQTILAPAQHARQSRITSGEEEWRQCRKDQDG